MNKLLKNIQDYKTQVNTIVGASNEVPIERQSIVEFSISGTESEVQTEINHRRMGL